MPRDALRRSAAALLAGMLVASGAAAAEQIRVVSPRGQDAIPLEHRAGVAVVPLDQIAHVLRGTLHAGAETARLDLAAGTALVATGKSFVRVGDELVLLSAPATVGDGRWLVPVDFLVKVVPRIAAETVRYDDDRRLLVVGEEFPRLDVRTFPYPAYTRVVLEPERPLSMRVDQTSERITVHIEADYLDTSFREEELLDGVVDRLVLERGADGYDLRIDLGPRFGTVKAYELDAPPRLVLDLFRSRVPTDVVSSETSAVAPISPDETGAEPPATAVEPPVPPPPPAPVPPPPDRPFGPGALDDGRLRIVTIDPGHGGAETGAQGPGGLVEKEVTLAIARELRGLLEDRLGVRVLLTRDGDRDLDLDERAELANANKADLFISIHANGSPRPSARGSEVFYLSYEASDDEARRVAAAENLLPVAASARRSTDLEFILWDMAQAAYLNESASLAETLLEELLASAGEEGNRGVKQAPFRVLMGATMPAVLVEVGFITNPEEEKLLGSPAHRRRIAEALYRGIVRYKERYERLIGAGAPQDAAVR